jgi:hypothetical protein
MLTLQPSNAQAVIACKRDISSSFLYAQNGKHYFYIDQKPQASHYWVTLDSTIVKPYLIKLSGLALGAMIFVDEKLVFLSKKESDSVILHPIQLNAFENKGYVTLSILLDGYQKSNWKCCLADTAESTTVQSEWRLIPKPVTYFDKASVVSVWLLFLIIVLAWVSDKALFLQAIWPSGFLTSTYANELAARKNLTDSGTLYQLFGLLIVLFLWAFLKAYPISDNLLEGMLDQLRGYPGFLGFLIAYQIIMIPLFARLFKLGSVGRVHTIVGLRLNVALVCLLTAVWVLVYIRTPVQDFLHSELIHWIILFYAGLRAANIILSLNKVAIVFDLGFFSYLCATEFLPLLVLISRLK